MNYDEIVARIKKGENPEAIVKEFTDNMNKAQAAMKAEQEAKAKEDAKSKKLDEIAVVMADAINEYALVAGITVDEVKVQPAEVREMLDSFLPLFEQFKDVKIHVAKATPKKVKTANVDDIFRSFWKEFNI